MFCTTECWNCEDKNCEHYISKQELYFDNQLLESTLNEIKEQLKLERKIALSLNKPYTVSVIDKILDKVVDL